MSSLNSQYKYQYQENKWGRISVKLLCLSGRLSIPSFFKTAVINNLDRYQTLAEKLLANKNI